MARLDELSAYCDQLLQVSSFSDYCPNGLQVDAGVPEVTTLVSGVTACQALIDRAVELEAELLLVHHGFFWRGEAQPLTGIKGSRVRRLMCSGTSLLAYHLPLDAHPELGNNRGLGRALGVDGSPLEGSDGLLWLADLDQELSCRELAGRVAIQLQREPLHLGGGRGGIRRLAWCTGAAQGMIEQAAAAGADAFISGEASEQSQHLAAELGIHYFSAGHHATERFGPRALGEHLAERFSLRHHFVDIDNPV